MRGVGAHADGSIGAFRTNLPSGIIKRTIAATDKGASCVDYGLNRSVPTP